MTTQGCNHHHYKAFFIFFGLLFAISVRCVATPRTDDIPFIGKACPNYLLKDIQNYSVTEQSVRQLKGKAFLLDFFSLGCTSCYESFPKIHELKQAFGDSLDVILVGEMVPGIKEQFETFEKRYGLKLPVCYSKELFARLAIHSVPYIVWVGADGLVKAVTPSEDVNLHNITQFLANKPVSFIDISHAAEVKRDLSYDYHKPLLVNNNGGADTSYYFRSVLAPASVITNQQVPIFINNTQFKGYGYMSKNRYQATGIWLAMMYQVAYGDTVWQYPDLRGPTYYGSYAQHLELDIRDSSLFTEMDTKTSKGYYNYSLTVPDWKSSTLDMQHIMQRDLENYFGYKVSVVVKESPCWVLTDSAAAPHIRSKGGDTVAMCDDRTKTVLTNAPMKSLIMQLARYHFEEGPFIDETRIDYPVDITVNAFPDESLELWTAHLRPLGLLLTKTTRKLKVIVVKDPE